MPVVVIDRADVAPHLSPRGIQLRVDNWDDYTFRTTYEATLKTDTEVVHLGNVKVLRRGQDTGRSLDLGILDVNNEDYISLGQSIEYYEKLMAVPRNLRQQYLMTVRDAAFDSSIAESFANEAGWNNSLLRFGQAVNALRAGRNLLHGQEARLGELNFSLNWRQEGTSTPIAFNFDDSGELPGRCHALIGYNGVGKTTLLAELALAASRGGSGESPEDASTLSGDDTTFGAVVAVSYSAFDTFRTPESVTATSPADDVSNHSRTEVFGYVYCGLRHLVDQIESDSHSAYKLKSIVEIEQEFAEALRLAGTRSDGREHIVSAFEALSGEPSFGRAGVNLAELGRGMDTQGAIGAFRALSTGHKIVLNIVAQLAAHLRTRSLVLIDEPESHLHPPLTAALLRAVQILLKAHDSFAVVATHSPVVVQEIPAKHVTIMERYVDEVVPRGTKIETFGENVGAITRHIFSLDSSSTDYQGALASLAQRYTLSEIEEMFSPGLSTQARALVLTYKART